MPLKSRQEKGPLQVMLYTDEKKKCRVNDRWMTGKKTSSVALPDKIKQKPPNTEADGIETGTQ